VGFQESIRSVGEVVMGVPVTPSMVLPVVVPLVDEGLGNSSYLVDLGDGRGLAVDPSRDLRGLRRAADAAGLRVAFAADTHLHADFLTGALQLAATDGARVLASADGGRAYPHTGLADDDEVDLGGLKLRTIATPGHTGEHIALLLLDGDRPVGVFTGGSLIVGSAARTDLVDPHRTVELARAQYASIQRLLQLPDQTAVWPTHGAGSFCSAPPGAERVSTIGRERATNPLLVDATGAAAGEEEFVARLLAGLGSYPAYFTRLGEVNRLGPPPLPASVALPGLDPVQVQTLMAAGGQLVDVRPVADYSDGHIPGSLSDQLRPAFATWLGWTTTPDRLIVIVRNTDQDRDEIIWQARKIGYDNLVGELSDGFATWRSAGLPVAATPLMSPSQATDRLDGSPALQVLDIRQDSEYATGHLPTAAHLELGALIDSAPPGCAAAVQLPAGPLLVMCGHGERAMTAASLIQATGRDDVFVLAGGPEELAAATGSELATGPGIVPAAT
jgi:hydroxyacylglutathione hydrolase